MSRRPRLILSRQAVAQNYQRLSSVSGNAECAASIKADAYGVGIGFVAPILWEEGCRTYFVAYLEEALALRELLHDATIYVFHGFDPQDFDVARSARIRPVINLSEEALNPKIKQLNPAVHVDTGMRRLGIPQYEMGRILDLVERSNPSLLMSHLSKADEPQSADNLIQLELFNSIRHELGGACPSSSLANTAGILLGPAFHFELVRPGIGLYGGSPDPNDPKGFEPVVTWQAQVMELQDVAMGEPVGYGGSFLAPCALKLATIGIGYADGYHRILGGQGEVAIDGQICPIVGRVSMDLVTLDVSAIPNIKQGTWVEIMGPTISIDTMAVKANTIAYELLTRLGPRMDRVLV
ncbi:MAG: alanine racemase [Gammaproteobacteria bacterium]|nr:alanine racemase [Gammaproteobacteria bacterium]